MRTRFAMPCLSYMQRAILAMIALAASSRATCEVPEGFTGIRPAGMGGAFTGLANDENSVWTNPAGIGRTRKARSRDAVHLAKFPNLLVGANSSTRSFYTAVTTASGSSVADVAASSDAVADKPFYVRAAAFPVMIFEPENNFPMALGIYENSVSKIYIDKDTPTDARISAINDVGPVWGVSYSNFANRLNFGLSLRPTYRYAYEDTIPSEELVSKTAMSKRVRKDSNRGVGIGIDAGFMFTLADFWFPTIGMAIRNLPTGCKDDYLNPYTEQRQKICGTKYSGSSGNPDALSALDPMDVRAGISISPRVSHDYGVRFAADVQNLYVRTTSSYYGLPGADISKLLHGGVEAFTGNPLVQGEYSARMGINQGYFTYGFSAYISFFHFDFASYAVDISDQAKKVEDRRYLVSTGAAF